MLDGLDDVDWARLTHANGPASDVPDQLRGLVSPDAGEREDAWHGLFGRRGTVLYRGMTTEAGVAAVPFLIDLVWERDTPLRSDLLATLSEIAIGRDEFVLPQGVPWHYAGEPAYQAVGQAVPFARVWLRDEQVEDQAARLLAWFPTQADASLVALWARVEGAEVGEADTCLPAIGLLGRPGDAALCARLKPYVAGEDPVKRIGAAIALARLAPDEFADDAFDTLVAAARGETPGWEIFAFFYSDGLSDYAAASLGRLPEARRIVAAEALADALARAERNTAEVVLLHRMLKLAFPRRVAHGTPFTALEPHQQRALLACREAPAFNYTTGWGFGQLRELVERFGLPGDADAFVAYVTPARDA